MAHNGLVLRGLSVSWTGFARRYYQWSVPTLTEMLQLDACGAPCFHRRTSAYLTFSRVCPVLAVANNRATASTCYSRRDHALMVPLVALWHVPSITSCR